MQFSSKPPFNDDPKPYVTYADERKTDVRNAEWGIQSDGATEYVRVLDPRPEYDRPQHNPTNPILTEFRDIYHETTPTIYQGYWELAEIWLELMDEDPFMREYRNWGRLVDIVESDHIHHARRVFEGLTR